MAAGAKGGEQQFQTPKKSNGYSESKTIHFSSESKPPKKRIVFLAKASPERTYAFQAKFPKIVTILKQSWKSRSQQGLLRSTEEAWKVRHFQIRPQWCKSCCNAPTGCGMPSTRSFVSILDEAKSEGEVIILKIDEQAFEKISKEVRNLSSSVPTTQ